MENRCTPNFIPNSVKESTGEAIPLARNFHSRALGPGAQYSVSVSHHIQLKGCVWWGVEKWGNQNISRSMWPGDIISILSSRDLGVWGTLTFGDEMRGIRIIFGIGGFRKWRRGLWVSTY